MTRRLALTVIAVALGLLMLERSGLQAQSNALGTFRWQLQPFCNILTVTVVQDGAQYHLDGTDDLCGASRKASVVGLAFPNPDGSIGFGLTSVTAPGGTPMHVDATISVATLGGTWRDSGGNSGAFVFTPGSGTGGSVRPIPAGGIAPGSITSAHLAAGSVTATQLAPGSVTAAQLAPGALNAAAAAFGTCPAGQDLRGIRANGTVLCETAGMPPLSTNVDDVANQVGLWTSLAIGTDGLAIIGHRDETAGALRITHCLNAACTSATSTNVDVGGNAVGLYPAIAIGSDGLPVISHQDDVTRALRVTHCHDVACSNATSTTVDDPANQVGVDSSIAIGTDGLPIISHTEVISGLTFALRITHCHDLACTSATSTTIDAVNSVGLFPSLAIGPDGRPLIAHRDQTAGTLRMTRCADAACTSATSTTIDDPANLVGIMPSLALGADGLPVISHMDETAGALRVTHCQDLACAGATSTTVDDPANTVGTFSSLAIGTDGVPVISHRSFEDQALRVTHCNNAACTGATSVTADDPTNSVGRYGTLAIGADGLPIIAHRDDSLAALRITKCTTLTCR